MKAPSVHDSGEAWNRWLHDRQAHRAPIDAHFADAIFWLAEAHRERQETELRTMGDNRTIDVLEIGPADQLDLRDKLTSTFYRIGQTEPALTWHAVEIAGKANEAEGVVDISHDWEEHTSIPFDNESMDAIFAREVFEHVYQLGPMLLECLRILRPGGRLWFSTPFSFPLHDVETGDYWRITPKGWLRLLTDTGYPTCEVWPARLLFDNWQTPISVLGWAEK